jgi:hypothetical protein
VLWQWNPRGATIFGAYDTQAITPALQGAVDIGIWGAGCNATERQPGFAITAVVAEESSDSIAPVISGLPGQKFRADGTIDNWLRPYAPDLGRYLLPEALLQSPQYVEETAFKGKGVPAYAYAQNLPGIVVDRDGNQVAEGAAIGTMIEPGGGTLIGLGVGGIIAAGTLLCIGTHCMSQPTETKRQPKSDDCPDKPKPPSQRECAKLHYVVLATCTFSATGMSWAEQWGLAPGQPSLAEQFKICNSEAAMCRAECMAGGRSCLDVYSSVMKPRF